MSDISHIPLSNHEIFQAKALAKKYNEAAQRAWSSKWNENIPEWIAFNAMRNFLLQERELERDIANGAAAFCVRLKLQFPLELPENGEDV